MIQDEMIQSIKMLFVHGLYNKYLNIGLFNYKKNEKKNKGCLKYMLKTPTENCNKNKMLLIDSLVFIIYIKMFTIILC